MSAGAASPPSAAGAASPPSAAGAASPPSAAGAASPPSAAGAASPPSAAGAASPSAAAAGTLTVNGLSASTGPEVRYLIYRESSVPSYVASSTATTPSASTVTAPV